MMSGKRSEVLDSSSRTQSWRTCWSARGPQASCQHIERLPSRIGFWRRVVAANCASSSLCCWEDSVTARITSSEFSPVQSWSSMYRSWCRCSRTKASSSGVKSSLSGVSGSAWATAYSAAVRRLVFGLWRAQAMLSRVAGSFGHPSSRVMSAAHCVAVSGPSLMTWSSAGSTGAGVAGAGSLKFPNLAAMMSTALDRTPPSSWRRVWKAMRRTCAS